MRDRLSCWTEEAEVKARSSDLVRRDAGSQARTLGLWFKHLAVSNIRTARLIDDVLLFAELLRVEGDCGVKVTDETIVSAVKSAGSMKEAAAKAGVHPRTIARRLKTLSGQSVAGVQLATAPSLRRSQSIKAKRNNL
jgi:hypothetical protein